MNSFTLFAVGHLDRDPERVAMGDSGYTRFCLVGGEAVGRDCEGPLRETMTRLWFMAFDPLGERIWHDTRKGDQLILQARVRVNVWTDAAGEKHDHHTFITQDFRLGALARAQSDRGQNNMTAPRDH